MRVMDKQREVAREAGVEVRVKCLVFKLLRFRHAVLVCWSENFEMAYRSMAWGLGLRFL